MRALRRAAPTSDPLGAFGPVSEPLPTSHPIVNAAGRAVATPGGVWFEGGRVDALIRCGSLLLRTARSERTQAGLAQVRRRISGDGFEVEHVFFAPLEPRPLMLSLVVLRNSCAEPLRVDYTELWEVAGTGTRAEPGACVCDTEAGSRALADASIAIRGEAPHPLPTAGLALNLRIGLAPGATRELSFVYAAPGPNEDPSRLVQGWRGDVRRSLQRTVEDWLARLPAPSSGGDPVADYRSAVGQIE